MNNDQLINQTSEDVELYTPSIFMELARAVMDRIDLDPASSAVANEVVKASSIYTQADDGLSKPWFGNVWLNWPRTKEATPKWAEKVIGAYRRSEIRQACIISWASTSEKWFAPFYAYPIAYITPRVRYMLPDGTETTSPPKGSCVIYLGDDWGKFTHYFNGRLGDTRYTGHVQAPLRHITYDFANMY